MGADGELVGQGVVETGGEATEVEGAARGDLGAGGDNGNGGGFIILGARILRRIHDASANGDTGATGFGRVSRLGVGGTSGGEGQQAGESKSTHS